MQIRYHCEMVYVSFCRLLVTIFLTLVSIFQIRLFFYYNRFILNMLSIYMNRLSQWNLTLCFLFVLANCMF